MTCLLYYIKKKKKKKTVTPPPPILAKTERGAEISHLTGCNKASQNSSCILVKKLNSNQNIHSFSMITNFLFPKSVWEGQLGSQYFHPHQH